MALRLTSVPSYNDAMNKILDLQRDLHASDVARCEELTFGIRTLPFAFLFLPERVGHPSLNAWGLLRLLLTLQLSASVSWRGDAFLCNPWHCWFCWHLPLLSGVLKMAPNSSPSPERIW